MMQPAAYLVPNLELEALAAKEDTVLCSVVSDDFAAGFIVMERSLRRHNPDWTFPIIAVHSSIKPLSELSKAVIREHCDNCISPPPTMWQWPRSMTMRAR